jgi:hypothetical protein
VHVALYSIHNRVIDCVQHLVREEWLDAIEALLYHVHDLPEDGLVKLIVFVLSSVSAEVGDHCCCATGTVIHAPSSYSTVLWGPWRSHAEREQPPGQAAARHGPYADLLVPEGTQRHTLASSNQRYR